MDNLGFISLGIKGERMCRNLAIRSRQTVVGFDKKQERLEALRTILSKLFNELPH